MATNRWQSDAAPQQAPTVVGFFSNGVDAERALLDLQRAGFGPQQLGAAFRDQYPASGTSGSDYDASSTSGSEASRTPSGGSWWSRVKGVFSSESHEAKKAPAGTTQTGVTAIEETAQKFGTGEGYLNLSEPEHSYDYSSTDFESSLGDVGVRAERARYFSTALRRGGAVVTVNATVRAAEAEEIIKRNNGRAGSESQIDASAANLPGAGPSVSGTSGEPLEETPQRVQMFGEILRVHRDRRERGGLHVREDTMTSEKQVRRI